MGQGECADVRGGAGFGVGGATTLHRAPCRSLSRYCGVLGDEYHSLRGSPVTPTTGVNALADYTLCVLVAVRRTVL